MRGKRLAFVLLQDADVLPVDCRQLVVMRGDGHVPAVWGPRGPPSNLARSWARVAPPLQGRRALIVYIVAGVKATRDVLDLKFTGAAVGGHACVVDLGDDGRLAVGGRSEAKVGRLVPRALVCLVADEQDCLCADLPHAAPRAGAACGRDHFGASSAQGCAELYGEPVRELLCCLIDSSSGCLPCLVQNSYNRPRGRRLGSGPAGPGLVACLPRGRPSSSRAVARLLRLLAVRTPVWLWPLLPGSLLTRGGGGVQVCEGIAAALISVPRPCAARMPPLPRRRGFTGALACGRGCCGSASREWRGPCPGAAARCPGLRMGSPLVFRKVPSFKSLESLLSR